MIELYPKNISFCFDILPTINHINIVFRYNYLVTGVPQGCVISPLLYILFTCDIPALAHLHPVSLGPSSSINTSTINITTSTICQEARCGTTISYIDDNTSSISCDTAEELSNRLSKEYATMSSYMSSNKLLINDEKTKLIVMCKKTRKDERKDVSIKAGNHVINPSATHKLLTFQKL